MRVNEFIDMINAGKVENIDNVLDTKKYIPVQVKYATAQAIMYDCTEEVNGAIKMNTFHRYMSFIKHMINIHTNLEYTDEDYDVMCSTNYNGVSLMDAVMNTFTDDGKECSNILEMVSNDIMYDNSIEMSVAKALNNIDIKIRDVLKNTFDGLKKDIPDNVDMNELSKMLEIYTSQNKEMS